MEEQTLSKNEEQGPAKKDTSPWHDYFSGIFKEALIPLDLEVESDYAVGKGPPKVDVLIIRRKGSKWTDKQLEHLPDGVRHSKCSHVIMELKKTESIVKPSVWQSLGYLGRFLDYKNLKEKKDYKNLILQHQKFPVFINPRLMFLVL